MKNSQERMRGEDFRENSRGSMEVDEAGPPAEEAAEAVGPPAEEAAGPLAVEESAGQDKWDGWWKEDRNQKEWAGTDEWGSWRAGQDEWKEDRNRMTW